VSSNPKNAAQNRNRIRIKSWYLEFFPEFPPGILPRNSSRNSCKGGDSTAALGMVETLRDMPGVPYDNQLLAALDHYFNMRAVHNHYSWPTGWMLAANAALALWKCLGLPFPTDTSKPYSPPSLLQWAAGNWGVADSVERKR